MDRVPGTGTTDPACTRAVLMLSIVPVLKDYTGNEQFQLPSHWSRGLITCIPGSLQGEPGVSLGALDHAAMVLTDVCGFTTLARVAQYNT